MPEPAITPLRVPGRAPRVLTIDAEDWFHVCGDEYYSDPRRWDSFVPRIESSLRLLFDALLPGSHRATVFFVGWIARRYPELVREAATRGHEIGVHGDFHRRADEMSRREFRDDLDRARGSVENAGGSPANVHRAAEWSIRLPGAPALAEVASAGFLCDASMMPVPPLGSATNPSGPCRIRGDSWAVTEMPPLTGRVLGRPLPMGGAWPFRMLPERTLAAAEEKARNGGKPAVFTLHPWEIDPAHPPADGFSPITRLVHFAGLRGLPARLERWLARDRCVAIGDVLPALQPS